LTLFLTMDDILQSYVDKNALSKKAILRYVDDYSIYSKYIGEELELYTKYSSPLRKGDDDPSFSIYYSKYREDKILFKDQSTGKYGDVFDFVQELMENGELPPMKTVLLQINSDFGLGLTDEEVKDFKPKLLKKAPPKKSPTKIEITAHPIPTKEYVDYWNFLEVSSATLQRYYTRNVRVIHYKHDDSHITIVPKDLTISYEILGHYKTYQPFGDRKYKFRNDYLDTYVEGAIQLPFKKDFAIITKSTKECIFFWEHFKWECIAGKSENTPINPYFMKEVLHKQYKRVFIWLDPDKAGAAAQSRYIEQYPWLEPIVFHDSIKEKDPTDLFTQAKRRGQRDLALKYLENLITHKLK